MKRKKKPKNRNPEDSFLISFKIKKKIMQDLLQKDTFATTVPREGSKGERYRNNLKGRCKSNTTSLLCCKGSFSLSLLL